VTHFAKEAHPMTRAFRTLATAALAALLYGCAGAGQTTGEFVDDSTVTTKVKTKLYADADTSGWDIHVTTEKGVVVLSGTVKSSKEKSRAGEIARAVPGVKSVVNNLAVK
jgi:osmotically-inducible protein OsmY